MTRRCLLALVTLLAACTPGKLGTLNDGSSATSPGSVTLKLVVPSERAYCDVPCTNAWHIGVFTLDGASIGDGQPPSCGVSSCDTCLAGPCLAIPVFRCDPVAVPFMGATTSWDGLFYEASTCGRNHLACSSARYVLPGRYLARMCATPGTIEPSDAGVSTIEPTDAGAPTCTATGPEACVDVPFDLPGPSPVIGTLPSGAMGS